MNIEELYTYILKNNIELIYTDELINMNALYINIDKQDYIFMRKGLTVTEEKLAIAEEIGHFMQGVTPTPPFTTNYYEVLQRSKNEYKAFKWCVSKLIPFEYIKSIFRQDKFKFEVAEELSLPEHFIKKACEMYIDNMQQF